MGKIQLLITLDEKDYEELNTFYILNLGTEEYRKTIEKHCIDAIRHGKPYDPQSDCISRKVIKGLISDKSIPIKFEEEKIGDWQRSSGVLLSDVYKVIDNAPAIKFSLLPADESKDEAYMRGHEVGKLEGIIKGMAIAEKSQGKCKTCKHRDPEDKKCDCGALERHGCSFPVSDDYCCKFYEKGSTE